MHGIITAVRRDKGFAFLRGDDGHDRFFNRTNLARGGPSFEDLEEGTAVEFTPYALPASADKPGDHNNLRARQVRVVNS